MLLPRGLDGTRRLHVVIFVLTVLAIALVAAGRFGRAMKSGEPSIASHAASLTAIIDAGPVSIHSVVQGNLAVDERQAWSFAGTKGQRIAIAVYGAWDSHLTLLMPDGIQSLTLDGFSGGNGQAFISGVTLPMDGTYRIVVSGEHGGSGNYELDVAMAEPGAPGVMLKSGDGNGPNLIKR